jgi:hypothetical protein
LKEDIETRGINIKKSMKATASARTTQARIRAVSALRNKRKRK